MATFLQIYGFNPLPPPLAGRPVDAHLKIKSDPQGAGVRRGSDHPLTPKSVLTFLGEGSDPPQERSDFSRGGGSDPPKSVLTFLGAGAAVGLNVRPPPGVTSA